MVCIGVLFVAAFMFDSILDVVKNNALLSWGFCFGCRVTDQVCEVVGVVHIVGVVFVLPVETGNLEICFA